MNAETTVGTFSRPDDRERVLVIQRANGLFTYKRQWTDQQGQWGAPGVPCGLYDSPGTAAAEARTRIWWLHAMSKASEE
jgi:hypothetical protein